MSFMLKIALALQLTAVSAVALAGTSADPKSTQIESTQTESTSTDQNFTGPVLGRVSCDACLDGFNQCLEEGISEAACRRTYANCFRNCI